MTIFEKDLKNFGEEKSWAKYLANLSLHLVVYLTIVITVNSYFYGHL